MKQKNKEVAALEDVLRKRGYVVPLTPKWLESHMDHYQRVIDAHSRLRSAILIAIKE